MSRTAIPGRSMTSSIPFGRFNDVEGERAFGGDVRARPEPVDNPPEILVGRKLIGPFQIDAPHAAYSSKRDHGWGGNRF